MRVDVARDHLNHLHDFDEIIMFIVDFYEIRERAEYMNLDLNRDQWTQIIRRVNRNFNNSRLLEFIDAELERICSRPDHDEDEECDDPDCAFCAP